MENFIKSKSSEIANAYSEVATSGCKYIFTFEIDTTKLKPAFANEINITKDVDFVEMFEQLQAFDDLPALYFFGINPDIEYEKINDLIKEISISNNLNFPANNKNTLNKGILYIGKVKRCAWGRLIQHLGYHSNTKSHGLQIDHWAKKIISPLNLTYTVMFFDKSIADYLEIIERALARQYKPIIGKH